METFVQDLRYAARSLAKQPGFAVMQADPLADARGYQPGYQPFKRQSAAPTLGYGAAVRQQM